MYRSRLLITMFLAAACDVETVSHINDKPLRTSPDAAVDAQAAAVDFSGFYVIHSDYSTSSVSVIDTTGKVLAKTLVTSGSQPPGLSIALGADTVAPTQPQQGDEIVLIDRSNHAIHWVNLEDGKVSRQTSVGPGGFAANPYDYVAVHSELAFVTRFQTNENPGQAELDQGGDLLALNPEDGSLLGRVDFNYLTKGNEGLQPRPSSALHHDEHVYVVLGFLDETWAAVQDSQLVSVEIEDLAVRDNLDLGLRNCESSSLAPSSERLAVACKGDWQDEDASQASGVVLVDISSDPLKIDITYPASALVQAQINGVTFASDKYLLFTSYGVASDDPIPERAWLLDLDTGEVAAEPISQAAPFSLGVVLCVPDHGVCAVGNAEAGVVELFALQGNDGGSWLEPLRSVNVNDGIGLPPRYIGAL